MNAIDDLDRLIALGWGDTPKEQIPPDVLEGRANTPHPDLRGRCLKCKLRIDDSQLYCTHCVQLRTATAAKRKLP